ncbi:MAG: metallophosphoesterase [Succinivibrio sp.]|jgi:serine/threonine protein phosphatase 1|nr:metallophosphoesterase [Succinivibrio sp.]
MTDTCAIDRKTYRRVLAVGDIHGCCTQLEALLEAVGFDEAQDLLVLMGDYTDNGGDAVSTVKFVMELASHPHVVCLRGNHDVMCLESYRIIPDPKSCDPGDPWMSNGGLPTRQAFAGQERFEPGFIRNYLAFLAGCPLCLRLDNSRGKFLFAHAGIDPEKNFALQSCDSFTAIRDEFICRYQGILDDEKVTVVAGHTPVACVPEALDAGRALNPAWSAAASS